MSVLEAMTRGVAHERYLLVHERHGVFLGELDGEVFWSRVEAAGQHMASTFGSPDEVDQYCENWPEIHREQTRVMPVHCRHARYASEEECVSAGARPWTGSQEIH